MNMVQTNNPHWVGDYPAWDITLPSGEVRKSVTQKDIQIAMQHLLGKGLIRTYDAHVDVVRQYHIDAYAKLYVQGSQE